LLAAGISIWRVWKKRGGENPIVMAGHSLGEYTALVAAGALHFTDAVSLVAARGRFMQQAVPEGEGAMAAILGLGDDLVRDACTRASQGQVVEAVNFNSPGQVVIAGNKEAVQRAIEAATSAGAKKAIPLPVSVPSHCALMQPAAEKLKEKLKEINMSEPEIPVIHNSSVNKEYSPEMIRQRLVEQLYSPVRWVETIETMKREGVQHFIEAGPGKVLTGLMRRIDRQVEASALFDSAGMDKLVETLND
jgi:[acyl-carrier-protein] S-malonyltransferase